MLWNQHLKNFFFMCVTNSKQKFHMWNKNENILGHFVYFMCENNRIILYIYFKKKMWIVFHLALQPITF